MCSRGRWLWLNCRRNTIEQGMTGRHFEITPETCGNSWAPRMSSLPFSLRAMVLSCLSDHLHESQGYGQLVAAKVPRSGGPFGDPGPVLRMEFQRACKLRPLAKGLVRPIWLICRRCSSGLIRQPQRRPAATPRRFSHFR